MSHKQNNSESIAEGMEGMINKQKSHAVIRLSDKLMETIIDQDQYTTSDFQAALEAVILNAINYGETKDEKYTS